MEDIEKDKKDYIRHWDNYVCILNLLVMNPDKALGDEVAETVNKLRGLVRKVADAKYDSPKASS